MRLYRDIRKVLQAYDKGLVNLNDATERIMVLVCDHINKAEA